MTVFELYEGISALCPRELSCSWDNDGIMVCSDLNREVKKVLVSLDASLDAVKSAVDGGYDVLVTHHPMLFRGAKSVVGGSLCGERIISALSGGVSVLSFHTRLDACAGGVNDALGEALGLGFGSMERFGDEESPELCRAGVLMQPMTAFELCRRVKSALGCPAVRLNSGSRGAGTVVSKVGWCGGSGKDFLASAAKIGCQAFITGDADYNTTADVFEEYGMVTVEAGHYHTEAPVVPRLREWILGLGIGECGVFESCSYIIV